MCSMGLMTTLAHLDPLRGKWQQFKNWNMEIYTHNTMCWIKGVDCFHSLLALYSRVCIEINVSGCSMFIVFQSIHPKEDYYMQTQPHKCFINFFTAQYFLLKETKRKKLKQASTFFVICLGNFNMYSSFFFFLLLLSIYYQSGSN